ncbi:MAG: 16S rRNA (guanine527-N7)-methyltransferase [Motiliproteus sp.]|jgi:16S rRNA (guanine527-N7)-methyltransferase
MNPESHNELSEKCGQLLSEGLQQLDLVLTAEQQQQLLSYVGLLHRWNKTYNLTAVREPEAMIERHLLDSLSVVPYIEGQNIADVGTGPGLPGIVLAIVYPEKKFTLMDSNGKKTRFLQQVKQALALGNIDIYKGRVETYPEQQSFDTVISRAFASLNAMLSWTESLAAADGRFLAMKGAYPYQELTELPAGFELLNTYPLQVPNCEGERHLLEFRSVR